MDPAGIPEGKRDPRQQPAARQPAASVRSGVRVCGPTWTRAVGLEPVIRGSRRANAIPSPVRHTLRQVSSAGLEPAACCLGGSRSIHLSYEDDNHCLRVTAGLLSGRSVACLPGGRTGLHAPSIPASAVPLRAGARIPASASREPRATAPGDRQGSALAENFNSPTPNGYGGPGISAWLSPPAARAGRSPAARGPVISSGAHPYVLDQAPPTHVTPIDIAVPVDSHELHAAS